MMNYRLLVTIVLITALSAAGCSKKHDAGKAENTPVVVVKGVTLESVKNVAMPELLDVVGSVRARTSAVVSTRIPGSISVLRVREGDVLVLRDLVALHQLAPLDRPLAARAEDLLADPRAAAPVQQVEARGFRMGRRVEANRNRHQPKAHRPRPHRARRHHFTKAQGPGACQSRAAQTSSVTRQGRSAPTTATT